MKFLRKLNDGFEPLFDPFIWKFLKEKTISNFSVLFFHVKKTDYYAKLIDLQI